MLKFCTLIVCTKTKKQINNTIVIINNILSMAFSYTTEQLEKIWYNMAYRQDRHWAFLTAQNIWVHTDNKKRFTSFNSFQKYVWDLQVQDIHVKYLIDNTSREWIIDVDHADQDPRRVNLKNMIAHATFGPFFGPNITRIVFSGNRGLHIWLNAEEFCMKMTRDIREYYYDMMLKPPTIISNIMIKPNSLYHHFLQSFNNLWIKREIVSLYPDINFNDTQKLIMEFFPYVDRQVFVSTKQIRAPYSYNSKGKKFSCDHVLLHK
nr:lef-1 [Cnaphalocrocis medinalis granulovirus]